MRLVDRYICRQVLSHSLLGLVVFTFVFFVPQLVRLMELFVRHTTSWGEVGLLFSSVFPGIFTFTIPMAVLVGMLIGLGRLSADSELIAMNSLGMGPRRLLAPLGVLALAATLLTGVFTLWIGPIAVHTSRALQSRVLSSQASFEIQPRVFDERFPNLVLYIQDVSAVATRWHGIFLAGSNAENISRLTLAEDAIVIADREEGKLELHLRNGSVHEVALNDPNQYSLSAFGQRDWPINAGGFGKAEAPTPTLGEFPTHTLATMNGPDWLSARLELNRRLAFPAACIAFALIAIPLGARPRRGGRAGGFVLMLLLVCGYYALFVFGDRLARTGYLPPGVGTWLADIVIAGVGISMLPRMGRMPSESRWRGTLWRALTSPLGRKTTAEAAKAANGTNGFVSWAPAQMKKRLRIGFATVIDIYVLRSFLFYFTVLLVGFIVIFETFTLFELLDDIAKHRIATLDVLSYFEFLSVSLAYQLVPLAALTSVLVTLGILAKNNEIVALKAAGISLYRVSIPLLTVGLILAGGLLVLDDTYLPYANLRQDELRNEIKGRPPQTYFSPLHQWIFGENAKIYNYELFDAEHKLFGGLSVFELDPATFEVRRRVYAARAHWDPNQGIWILESGWVRDFQDGKVTSYVPFLAYALAELSEPPSYFNREVRQWDQMNWEELREYIHELRQAGFDVARLSVQLQMKLAFPLMSTIIILLAIPFSILVGTRGAIGGLALGVGVGIVYWAASALFEAMGAVGQLPPLLAGWAPDVIFAFLGLYFYLRMPT
ncbi:MAG TPA: LptF/LptG family permease [Methylomirabilota bacterium]|nr:LptF/LptG family permease [Methylomirabilota bacterium]